MMYPYMTMNDGMEIVHSDSEIVNGVETVRVYFEKPHGSDFHTAELLLPYRTWSKVRGFSDRKLRRLEKFVDMQVSLFYKFARSGGVFGDAEMF